MTGRATMICAATKSSPSSAGLPSSPDRAKATAAPRLGSRGRGKSSSRRSKVHAAPTADSADGTPFPPRPNVDPISRVDAAGADSSLSGEATRPPTPNSPAPRLTDPLLTLLAIELDSIEQERTRARNRLRIYTLPADEPDDDGHCRGFGIPADDPAIRVVAKTAEQLQDMEDALVLALKKRMRKHPLWTWAKPITGIGEKTLARLLGQIGDPYIRPESIDSKTGEVRPAGARNPAELRAYCGVHGSAGRRQKGVKSNWNAAAKMRVYLIAESCMKQMKSPYRAVYDAARRQYENKLHNEECRRCGGKGKPALPGSPWREGHKHMGAMRLVMRELLLDLWREAKRIHEATVEVIANGN